MVPSLDISYRIFWLWAGSRPIISSPKCGSIAQSIKASAVNFWTSLISLENCGISCSLTFKMFDAVFAWISLSMLDLVGLRSSFTLRMYGFSLTAVKSSVAPSSSMQLLLRFKLLSLNFYESMLDKCIIDSVPMLHFWRSMCESWEIALAAIKPSEIYLQH